MENYKIIHVMDDLASVGGVESFVFDLCNEMIEINNSITLIGIVDEGYKDNIEYINLLKNKGINVICLGAKTRLQAFVRYTFKLRKIIKEIAGNDCCICNLHLKLSVLMGVIATLGEKKIRCVETYHSNYHHYWMQNIVLSPFIKKYIACSESAKEEMLKRFCIRKSKVVFVNNGVNINEIRKVAGVPDPEIEHEKIILSIGRITEQKNFQSPIKAFSEIPYNGFVYDLYGDGEYKEILKQIKGDNAYIRIKDAIKREEVFKRINSATLVVLPSVFEGLSIFLLEVIALQCPMVLSDIPSFRKVLNERPLELNEPWRECSWGYLVRTTDVEAYKEVFEHIMNNLDNLKNKRHRIGEISLNYDISITAKKYIEEYDSLF